MAALLIAFAKVKDSSRLQEYSSAAGPTLAAGGGTILGRGRRMETLVGHLDVDSALVVRFPTVAAAHDWYHSPAYQALVPLRDQVLNGTFIVLEEPS